jgi:Icc protein
MKDHTHHGHAQQPQGKNDGIGRGGFLECMAWAGTGVVWMMSGGILFV